MKFTNRNRRLGRPILLLLMVLAAASGLRSQTAANVKEISLQKDGNRLNILLKIEGTYTVEASFLPAPPRLLIDLTPVNQLQVLPYTQIDDIGVLDIRTGQFKSDTARVVFDLSQNIPAYSVTQVAEGLKVSFWYEGEVPPIQVPVKQEPAQPAPKSTVSAMAPQIPPDGGRSNYFITARAGASIFFGSHLLIQKSFDIYGETAMLNETYDSGFAPVYEVQIGKYSGRAKFGFGASFWTHKQKPVFSLALPHPFLMNAFRTVEFTADNVKNPMWNFSLFALFSFVETDKITLWVGPMLGLTKGTYQTLSDFRFEEKSPYAAADVTISELVFFEDLYSELLFGGVFSLEYRLGERVNLVADLRILYVNPVLGSINQRANLLHIQPILGIQYNF